jgi:Fe-S cluster biogenesis protein NfuA
MPSSFHEEIASVLVLIRKQLVRHGGDIRLVDADEATGEVRVSFEGACVGCPFAAATFEGIVETALSDIAAVRRVRVDFGSEDGVAPADDGDV